MKRFFAQILFISVMMYLPIGTSYAESSKDNTSKITYTKSSVDLNAGMRKLWEDHVFYTRNFIISTLANLEDANKIAERLLKNQDDIGNAIKVYYGETAGNKLSKLLRDHILIAADVVNAAKAGNDVELKKASNKWSANADDIAVFLSNANPNWPKQTLIDMLHKHLDLTTAEVVARLKKDWSADIKAFDNGIDHMLIFSDTLSSGIVKQFPDKFKTMGKVASN